MKIDPMFAGAGTAYIHFPQELFPIDGFRGVHDDPAVRVLLLHCAEQVVIACMELVMLPPDGIDAVKKTIHTITHTQTENIWVHVTHAITTPHPPHTPMGMGGIPLTIPGQAETQTPLRQRTLFYQAVMQAVALAAERAVNSFRRARMGVGSGKCRVNKNRDVSTPHGWWIGSSPTGPSNHTATILRFEDEQATPIAALISYGLKPCAIDNAEMDVKKRLISSDVPGLACRILEEQLGAPCLFAMSAAGDQVPLEQAWYDVVEPDGSVRKVDLGVEAGLEIVDRLGHLMAQELSDVLKKIPCQQASPLIRLDHGSFDWPGKARSQMVPTLSVSYTLQGTQQVDIAVMTIGHIALVGVKPEVNTLTEAQLQAISPYPYTLVVSMVNGGQKYMPDLASYGNGTWEAQSSALMPGAAEAWVQETERILTRIQQST